MTHAAHPAQMQLTLGNRRRAVARDTADTKRTVMVQLVAIARELLTADADSPVTAAGVTHGVTFYAVREIAERRKIVPDKGCPPVGAAVMRAAGGVAAEHVPSKHPLAHGRSVRVFRLRVARPV